MAEFTLGNFAVSEVLYGTAQNFSDELLYTLDQLSSASIEISSDPQEITDKNGNIIKYLYKTKTGTFSASSALLSPAILNAGSGTDIQVASSASPIVMPKILVLDAGTTATIADADADTIKVISLYGNGANGKTLTKSTTAAYDTTNDTYTFAYDSTTTQITVPAAATDAPVQYLVKYDRDVTSGIVLSNRTDSFPSTVKLTLFVSVVDPCEDTLRAAYVYIPSFQADPSMTISLDSESQEVDFSGNLQTSYCDGSSILYYIYFPDEEAVLTASV